MDDNNIHQILENLVRESTFRVIVLRVTTEQSNRAATGSTPSTLRLDETYAQTAKGERYYDEHIRFPKSYEHRTGYCNGEKCATVVYQPPKREQQKLVQITYNFMDDMRWNSYNAPYPFKNFYIGFRPLVEALPDAEPLPPRTVLGKATDVFRFTKVGNPDAGQDLIVELDRASSVPLKVTSYRARAESGAPRLDWIWEATSLDSVAGHHLPLNSTWTLFQTSQKDGPADESLSTGDHEVFLFQKIHVDELAYDESAGHVSFWPEISPGVRVIDRTTKKVVSTSSLEASNPIRVSEPSSARWQVYAGVSLSLATAAVAYVLWKRAR